MPKRKLEGGEDEAESPRNSQEPEQTPIIQNDSIKESEPCSTAPADGTTVVVSQSEVPDVPEPAVEVSTASEATTGATDLDVQQIPVSQEQSAPGCEMPETACSSQSQAITEIVIENHPSQDEPMPEATQSKESKPEIICASIDASGIQLE